MLRRIGTVAVLGGGTIEVAAFVVERAYRATLAGSTVWFVGYIAVFLALPILLLARQSPSRSALVAQCVFAGIAVVSLALAILLAGNFASAEISTTRYRSFGFQMSEVALSLGAIAYPFGPRIARRVVGALAVAATASVTYAAAHGTYVFTTYEWFRYAEIPALLAAAVALPVALAGTRGDAADSAA
jgi:hypothetical protein